MNFKITLNHIPYLLLLFICKSGFAQRENSYQAEVSTIVGTEQTPFWMRANKYGMVPTKGNTAIFSIGTKSDYQETNSRINWGYGANIGAFAGFENKFIIQEAYVKAKWKVLEFYIGRRKEIQGLVDTTLTSGSYIWSGNALPMPKVQIAIPDYTPLGSNGLIALKGNYAHGWFDKGRSDASGVFLHQKSGYVRIGKPNWKFKFYNGFNHQAQWGGTAKIISARKYESSFKDYFGVVSGKSNIGNDTTGLDPNNAGNRTGNHLGTIDIALEIKLNKANIFLYRQNIFEDGSLFYLNNISDGLNGLSITFKNSLKSNFIINKVTFEFLNTLSEGGSGDSEAKLASKRGLDNYFNNSQYFDGWSSHNTSIGTPFILTAKQINNPTIPLSQLFVNNYIQAYYFAFEGNGLGNIFFRNRVSISNNWGAPGMRTNKKRQTSWSFFASKQFENKLGTFEVFSSLGLDIGDLFSSNFAVNIGLKKSWSNLHLTHQHIR